MLTLDQKKLIESNIPQSIVGAYEYGNQEILDYALKLSTLKDRHKAKNLAIIQGVDIDWQPSDEGNPPI